MDSRTAVSSGMWLKFFMNAGIPESVAASYANKFAENRIKKDMIKDLTKDILRDMGVSCMGDIIAILRHAKEVYDEEILERVIGQSTSSVQTATVRPTKVSSARRSSPSSRTQERHVRRSSSGARGSPELHSDVRESPAMSDRVKSSSHREAKSYSSIEKVFRKHTRSSDADDSASSVSRKRPESSSAGQSLLKTDSSVAVKRKVVDEEPVKKVRRVLPEHEGGYKITMPSGTTTHTQEILKKKAVLNASHKKSVFDRLGASSEDEAAPSSAADTTFRVTGLHGAPFASTSSSTKSSSVFSRLGDKSLQSTASNSTGDASVSNPLHYRGILKQPEKKVVLKLSTVMSSSNRTMRADKEQPIIRKKVTSIAPSFTTVILPAVKNTVILPAAKKTGILPAAKVTGQRLVSGRGCTMRADQEATLKVTGATPVVKRLRTTINRGTPAPVDTPVMRQIFKHKTTQGILAAPSNNQKISVKARLGFNSSTSQFVPGKKRVMFEKREVSFMGASETFHPLPQRSRVIFYQKPARTERTVPSYFKSNVFQRLGRNSE